SWEMWTIALVIISSVVKGLRLSRRSPLVDQGDNPRLMLLLQPLHDRRLAAAAVGILKVHRTARAAVVTPLHEDIGGTVVLPAALVAATGGLDCGYANRGDHGCLRVGVTGWVGYLPTT